VFIGLKTTSQPEKCPLSQKIPLSHCPRQFSMQGVVGFADC